jgi:hypothetical protein
MDGNHGREKRERRERGEARVTSRIRWLWWAARISNIGRWDEKTSGRYIGFSVGSGEGKKVWPGGCLNCFLCQIERVVEGIQFQTSRPALARP